MASKRTGGGETHQIPGKRAKEDVNDIKLDTFLKWCHDGQLWVNSKVHVGKEGSCANYGMTALTDIEQGEVLFEIPRKLLLSEKNTDLHEIISKEPECLSSESGWVPILVSLMYEYSKPASRWRPYLDLLPLTCELDLPMFWQQKLSEVKGTGVAEMVTKDLAAIEKEFNTIVLPFIKKHPQHFPKNCEDIELYKHMVSLVMAYSFNEPLHHDNADDTDSDNEDEVEIKSPPFMVPMADILNHVAKNNAQLQFAKDSLKMMATKPIAKGEEVFNTYGELSNAQLLHMYGFAERYPNNHYDTVDIGMSVLRDVAMTELQSDLKLVKEKWNYMEEIGQVSLDGGIVVGVMGVLTDDDLRGILKVLFMSKSEFETHRENEGWDEAETDEDEIYPMTFDKIKQLPEKWRSFLKSVCSNCMKKYNISLEQLEIQVASYVFCDRREQYSAYVKHGQLKILQNFLQSL